MVIATKWKNRRAFRTTRHSTYIISLKATTCDQPLCLHLLAGPTLQCHPFARIGINPSHLKPLKRKGLKACITTHNVISTYNFKTSKIGSYQHNILEDPQDLFLGSIHNWYPKWILFALLLEFNLQLTVCWPTSLSPLYTTARVKELDLAMFFGSWYLELTKFLSKALNCWESSWKLSIVWASGEWPCSEWDIQGGLLLNRGAFMTRIHAW